MIQGQVTSRLEAVNRVTIRGVSAPSQTVDAVIDTGFSGYLSLPPATITALRLPFAEARVYSLGNNAEVIFDLYEAVIIWDGQQREILVLVSEADALVGMALLKGFRLTIDAIDGGEVRIEVR